MTNSLTFISLFLLTFFGTGFSQSKKEIKKNKILSVTEWTIKMEDGKEITYKESYTAYDKNGNVTENTEYNKDGSIKKKETAVYDNLKGKIVQETKYEDKTKISVNKDDKQKDFFKKTVYKYNANNDKTEEQEFDSTNKLTKKKQYSYNSKGERILETTYDGENKLLKKTVYTYNSKSLLVEKKTYDASNQMETEKKFDYAF